MLVHSWVPGGMTPEAHCGTCTACGGLPGHGRIRVPMAQHRGLAGGRSGGSVG